jgi:hypothetical protein
MAAKVAYTGANNDALRAKRAMQDACPTETRDSSIDTANVENSKDVTLKQLELDQLLSNFRRVVLIANRFQEIAVPVDYYMNKVDGEIQSAEKQNLEYSQLERTRRRQFLDENPQGGIPGIPGVRTYDDKVLLAFWVTYGFAILGLVCIGFKLYGAPISTSNSILSMVVAILAGYGLAYSFIYTFA